MDIRPLRTEADCDWALAGIECCFRDEPLPGTPEADRFDVLADLIEGYETKHWPIGTVDPVEAIRLAMDLKALGQADLARVPGSRSRASEILSRRRALSLAAIRKLHSEWGIPAEALLAPYHLERG